jgi:hypothetical protein
VRRSSLAIFVNDIGPNPVSHGSRSSGAGDTH